MKKLSLSIMILFFIVSLDGQLFAQKDINFKVSEYYAGTSPEENLESAVDPLLDMFGFLSGGGLYNTADVHSIMGFDLGIKLTAMRVSDDQKPPFPELSYELQGGPLKGESVIPLPMLHAGIGLFGNLELLGRFFTYPMGSGEAEGNVTLIGVGAKYGLLQNFALPKVALVAAYHYLIVPEQYDFGDINNISAALIVSKGFPFITLYGGAGIEHIKLKVDLPDPFDDPDPFSKTNFRGNVGFKLTPFPFLFINLDYNFGASQGVTAGAGISIR